MALTPKLRASNHNPHLISTGSFDTADLIVNTAGGLVGYGLAAAVRKRRGTRAPRILARTCVVIPVLALAAVVVFVGQLQLPKPPHRGSEIAVVGLVQRRTGSAHGVSCRRFERRVVLRGGGGDGRETFLQAGLDFDE